MSGIPAISSERSEINVTPLIDVLLVLLIIFMVITPLAPRGLAAGVAHDAPIHITPRDAPNILEISGTGSLQLNGHPVSTEGLSGELDQLYSSQAGKALFIKANQNLEYRMVAQLIDRIRGVNPSITVGLLP
ncbi:MAG TPA: biopolymer transporter ExbD [Bryobacteraceae bacterium]|jgi:biopolymer transport protein ExbD